MSARSASLSVSVALGVTLLGPVLFPAEMYPGWGMLLAALGAVVLLALALARGMRALSRAVVVPLGMVLLLATWLTARSISSLNPAISFIGNVSQHAGSALWWIIAAWMLAAAWLSDRRAVREIVAVGAVSGAAFGAWGLLEAVTTGQRAWGSAAGPFENSSSLGTYLAVATLCALAWGLSSRELPTRGVAALCGLLSVAGIVAADSRAGLVGLVAGLAVAGLARFTPPARSVRFTLAGVLPVLALALSAALITAATSSLGSGALTAVRALGTERDAIWRSVAAQVAQAPLVGTGLEQFSAWVSWSLAGGTVSVNGTYDPHNALAGLMLGGGLVALLLWLAFAASALNASLAALHRAGRPAALSAIVGVPCALMGAAGFTWLAPAAAVLAAAVAGSLLGASEAPASDGVEQRTPWTHTLRAGAAVCLVACAAVIVLSTRMLPAEHAFVSGKDTLTAEEFAGLYDRWPDPAFAALAIDHVLTRGGDIAVADGASAAAQPQASWHVDLALREVYLAQVPLRDDPGAWPAFEAAIGRGVAADPASGLWYALAAAQADAMGRDDKAAAYAQLALELDPGPDERALLEEIVAAQ